MEQRRIGRGLGALGLGLLGSCGCGAGPGAATGPGSGAEPDSATGPGSSTDRPSTSPELDGPPTSTDTTDAGPTPSTTGAAPTPDLPVLDVGGAADPEAPVCSSDLQTVLDGVTGVPLEQCAPDLGCLDGRCVAPCVAAAGTPGSLGCAFVVPTSPFFANGNPDAAQSGPCHALLVSNPWPRPAVLELSREGLDYDVALVARIPQGIADDTAYDPLPDGMLPGGQVAVVFLSHRPGVHNGEPLECPIAPAVLDDTAVHGTGSGSAFSLTSDTPVQAYDIIPFGGASTFLPSASLLYPSAAWGDGYLAHAPHPPDGVEWVLAVARDDDTTVWVQPAVAMVPGAIADAPPGQVTAYSADAGQVLQWHAAGDPTGTVVSADKPIGVFTGNTFLAVDTADEPVSGHDSAHQMLPDVNALGSEYVGAGLFSRLPELAPESVLYRLVGVVDQTELEWDPGPPAGAPMVLMAGQSVQFETTEAFSVRARDEQHPFSLSQYMSGTLDGQPGCTGDPAPCQLGDEDWVVLVPPAQFLRSYALLVDPTYATSTLTVVRVAGPAGWPSVALSCRGLITEWRPVGAQARFEYAHVELFRGGTGTHPACETSQHLVTGDGAFGVVAWGTDRAASYGYPAGGSLRGLNQVDVSPAG